MFHQQTAEPKGSVPRVNNQPLEPRLQAGNVLQKHHVSNIHSTNKLSKTAEPKGSVPRVNNQPLESRLQAGNVLQKHHVSNIQSTNKLSKTAEPKGSVPRINNQPLESRAPKQRAMPGTQQPKAQRKNKYCILNYTEKNSVLPRKLKLLY